MVNARPQDEIGFISKPLEVACSDISPEELRNNMCLPPNSSAEDICALLFLEANRINSWDCPMKTMVKDFIADEPCDIKDLES